MIALINLTPDVREFYRHLSPPSIFELLALPGRFAVGAVKKSEDGEGAIPCGIMIWSVSDGQRFVIEWIYIDKDYRDEGAGTELMKAAFGLAKENSLPETAIRFRGEWTVQTYDHPLLAWLRNWHFNRVIETPPHWDIAVDELSAIARASGIDKFESSVEDIFSYSALTGKQKNELENIMTSEETAARFIVPAALTNIDEEHSFVILTDGNITGIMLLCACKKDYYPVFIWAERKASMKRLYSYLAYMTEDMKASARLRFLWKSWLDYEDGCRVLKDVTPVQTCLVVADSNTDFSDDVEVYYA